MKNILLTRIDDRLLHGQVIVSWIPYLKADEILIVDDEYSKDEFMSTLIKEAAPDNVKVDVLSVEDSRNYLNLNDEGSRLFILSRYIENVDKLIKLGIKISKLNIGGISNSHNRTKFKNAIHLSENELNMLKRMSEKGIRVEVQMLPNDKAIIIE
ncbi:PTS sugar transporter subunit IIB [Sedimentibacter sp. MB31-C6]|uniref:PTS sugar transporter subunit IIB n=1 Tax=Sedimentibacter sp. MB31-C6 TaxID=3109366 RepID=UPI002DDD07D5|nr:PTS sugar transporter subunit IIB [Sedimentibacter sp. MB36-C1]WSI04413.1 PTS sugar transporter subunit IIB [Sedimentibacter sp. MB36-C1]